MTRIRSALLAAALLAAPGLARPAAAQLQADVALKADFASAYVWRGVLLTNIPVITPSLGFALPAGAGKVALGVAAVVQPVSFQDSSYFALAGTAKVPNVGEIRPSLTLSQPFGALVFDFGAIYRMFPNGAGITKAGNTGTVQSRLGVRRATFDAGVTAGYDVGAVSGPFVEVGLRQALPITKGAALTLESRAGWSIDQKVHDAPAAFAPYQRSGFAWLDLGIGAALEVARVEVRPYLTLTHVPGAITTAPGEPERQKEWMAVVGASIGVHTILPPKPKATR